MITEWSQIYRRTTALMEADMQYAESDIYSGLLSSCYLDPMYHPSCLGCMDRNICYGEAEYPSFRKKAYIMSELLDDPGCLDPENSDNLAKTLGIEDSSGIIKQILCGKKCRDGKIWSIMKLSLGKPF